MKNLQISIFIVLISILSISCGDDFGDLNIDPTRPGGENADPVAIMPIMQTQTHRNLVSSAGRIAAIFTQQFQGFDAQQVAFTQYDVNEGTLANFWEVGLYTGSMRDCVDIIERSNLDGNIPHTKAVAQIYLAVNLGLATNLWGDIPYTEAFLGEDDLSPGYDSQEEVYSSIISLLDDAIQNLQLTDPNGGPLGNLVDSGSWESVAYALKARYELQLSKRDTQAATKALSSLQSAFTSNAETPIFTFEGNANGGHPLALFGIQRPNTLIIAPFFDNITNGDPRKPLYMTPNTDGDQLYYDNGNPDLYWAQLDSQSTLITLAEIKFIEAEALLLTNAPPTDVLQTIKEGVTANMEFLGISAADITAYTDNIITSDLETIINEKYKALYGSNPIQIWNDYRKTGFPSLTADPNGVNGSNPSGIIPRRILYPDSERLSNTESYDAAISNQGGHLLDNDMWVFGN